jgi:hypothetical protein
MNRRTWWTGVALPVRWPDRRRRSPRRGRAAHRRYRRRSIVEHNINILAISCIRVMRLGEFVIDDE